MRMNEHITKELRDEWSAALDAIEAVLEQRPGKHLEEVSIAVRSLVRMRDRLIELRRTQGLSQEAAAHLHQINAMLSVVASLEYPLAGLRWQRIEQVRDGLAQMLASTAHVA
jgi:hypothetical protein